MGVGDYVACLQRARRARHGAERGSALAERRRRKEPMARRMEGGAASGHQFENRRRPWALTTSGGSVDPVQRSWSLRTNGRLFARAPRPLRTHAALSVFLFLSLSPLTFGEKFTRKPGRNGREKEREKSVVDGGVWVRRMRKARRGWGARGCRRGWVGVAVLVAGRVARRKKRGRSGDEEGD